MTINWQNGNLIPVGSICSGAKKEKP